MDRLERLFLAARLHAPEDRAAFLDAACTDDPALRNELDELLRGDARADAESFLDDPVPNWSAARLQGFDDDDENDAMIGRRVGPYVMLRRLGRGGMGDVYLGVREQPFKQYVALKIIRRDTDTREVVVRFEMERQILAALNHPNVARLLDGGVTEDGLPFFAMEFVDGRPITAYCDEKRLNLRERLGLFRTVCQAVHYAHQNLIIHRDLKPSNILVTDSGTVKLLDFGIAKLLNPHLSPVDLPVTREDVRLMTPEYASPEQMRGESLTTAVDVYALGIILYELLTGHRPYRVSGRAPSAIVSIICEQEPERPSTRVLRPEVIDAGDGTESVILPDAVADTRSTPVERLRREIRGDLDNITLMALRKEPERRYGSAERLDDDIARYLSGMPIDARSNTLGYRAQKFAARHRASVLAAILVLLSLVGGMSVALWQAREAHVERDRAEHALMRYETTTDFLMDLFEASDPRQTKGMDVTARELLERGVQRADALVDQHEVQSHLLDVVGRVYQSLGQYETAEMLLNRAVLLRRSTLGEDHPLVAESMTRLASVLTRRGRYHESEVLLRDAIAIQEASFDGPNAARVNTLIELGYLLPFMGKWRESEGVYRQALEMRRAFLGPGHPDVANSMIVLGAVLRSQGRYDEAETIVRGALAMHRRLQGDAHPDVTNNMFQLALLLRYKAEYDEAESLLRRAIDIRRELAGEGDPEVSSYMFELGDVLALNQDSVEADSLIREALALRRRVLGDHPSTADGLLFLADFLHRNGGLTEADSLFREALSLRERLLGADHFEVAVLLRYLARLQMDLGRYPEAESLLTRAHALHLRANGPDHHHVASTLADLALLNHRTGQPEKAASLYLDALAILRKNHRDEHVAVQDLLRRLADSYEASGRPDEASKYRTQVRSTSVPR